MNDATRAKKARGIEEIAATEGGYMRGGIIIPSSAAVRQFGQPTELAPDKQSRPFKIIVQKAKHPNRVSARRLMDIITQDI